MADFKSLNGYTVKDEKARKELDRRLIYPSGDQTGEQDWMNIFTQLARDHVVTLAPGEFYLCQPINLRSSITIKGSGVKNTIVNTTTNFAQRAVTQTSVDYVSISDMSINGTPGHIGIDIRRDENAESETGGRYSSFRNLHMQGFSTCLAMGGCWCVDVDKCRLEAVQECVKQEGGCNNVNYTNCMFLGVEGQTYGAKIDATGGAQNCGVTFNNCDFERHIDAINASYCVGMTIKDIYCEGVARVFTLDSCPNFYMHGGYVTFPTDKLGNVSKSSTLSAYSPCTTTVEKVHVRLNKGSTISLLTISEECPLKMEQMSVSNDGGGKVYATHLDYSTNYSYGGDGATFTVDLVGNFLYHGDSGTFSIELPKRVKRNEYYKLIGMQIIPKSDVTLTANFDRVISANTETSVEIGSIRSTSGREFTANTAYDLALNNDRKQYTIFKDDVFAFKTSYGGVGVQCDCILRFKFARGEFVLHE